MDAEIIPGTPDVTAGTTVTTSLRSTTEPSEKRTQVITWFVGFAMLWLVISYTATGLISLHTPPSKEAYEFVTTMQAGLKDFILMVLGGFLGAITQKHQ